MKTLWLPFSPLGLSRIRRAWLRRSLLVLAVPVMTVFWSAWVTGWRLAQGVTLLVLIPLLALVSILRDVLNILMTTPAAAGRAWRGERAPADVLTANCGAPLKRAS